MEEFPQNRNQARRSAISVASPIQADLGGLHVPPDCLH